MDDTTRPLFTPAHRDSEQLQATADTPPNVGAATPAGLPVKSVTAGSGASVYSPPPRESPSREVPDEEMHSPACECSLCRDPALLDHLESSVIDEQNIGSECPFPMPLSTTSIDEMSHAARFRHSHWASIRRQVFESLKRTDQTHARVSAFAGCGSNTTIFQSKLQEKQPDGSLDYRFKVCANCCHDRFCSPCAEARSAQIRNSLMQMLKDKKISFITLTLQGRGESLTELVNRLLKHFRALRIHPIWADKVRGGAAFIEVKWSDRGKRWHPHLHIIADADFVPAGHLSEAWRSITRDSYIVDIKRVENLEKVGYYVTKYASKPMNASLLGNASRLDETIRALKGKRLCLTFGDWYGTPLTTAEDAALEGDLLDVAGYESTSITLNYLIEKAREREEWAIRMIRACGIYAQVEACLTPTRPPDPPGYQGEA